LTTADFSAVDVSKDGLKYLT